ncbi:MAG: thiamine-phosphate kinase [Solirubrobacterales bacterium]
MDDVLSESELIERLLRAVPTTGPDLLVGPGDDGAVVEGGAARAVSVDTIVDGVHFRRADGDPRAVGHKALGQALSDLAAMGGAAGQAYVALGVPPDLGPDEAQAMFEGLGAVARETGTAIAGGDVVACPVLWLAVTVSGSLGPRGAVLRSGARPGQVVAVTGELGGAAAGLALADGGDLDPGLAHPLLDRQRRPQPRLAAGRALADAGARALMDISDGLGIDAGRLAEASQAGVEIDLDRVPVHAGVAEVALLSDIDAADLVLGGEDYELLCCLDAGTVDAAREAVEATGTTLTTIGTITPGAGVRLLSGGVVRPDAGGYEHLAPGRRRP